jgi:hypothetical protein
VDAETFIRWGGDDDGDDGELVITTAALPKYLDDWKRRVDELPTEG